MVHVTWGVIIAAGKTEQISSEVETAFLSLGTRPVLAYSLSAYEQCSDISGIIVVVSKDRMDSVRGMSRMYGFSKVQHVVSGGSTRQTSVLNGLKAVDEEVSIVSIHDASRPRITPEIISETVKAAKRYGSGVAAAQLQDAIKKVEKGLTVSKSLDDGALWGAQTPQTYKREVIEKGYAVAGKKKISIEDDSSAVALTKEEVHLVESSSENMKIRTVNDFNVISCMMKSSG